MDTGTKISGIAHAVLIGGALFGGAFQSDPLPIEVQDVAVISGEEFAALIAAQEAPVPAPQPQDPTAPTEDSAPAIATPAPDTPVDQSLPGAAEAPQTEEVPDRLPAPLPPRPEAEVTETVPTIVPPDALETPLPPASVARPRPRPAERIAPQPVAPPPPDTRVDDVPRPDTAPDPGAQQPQDQQEAAAPEEATDRIDPEAQESDTLAPAASARPPQRPSGLAQRSAPDRSDAVNAALSEALSEASSEDGGAETPAPRSTPPSGPPLTSGEKNDLIVAVSRCWNVGSLSTEALNTTVVVAVEMMEDGKPIAGSIRLLTSSGGSQAAAQQAFLAARRAIIRCGAGGFDLPADKYGQWREIEMTFNPEKMRVR